MEGKESRGTRINFGCMDDMDVLPEPLHCTVRAGCHSSKLYTSIGQLIIGLIDYTLGLLVSFGALLRRDAPCYEIASHFTNFLSRSPFRRSNPDQPEVTCVKIKYKSSGHLDTWNYGQFHKWKRFEELPRQNRKITGFFFNRINLEMKKYSCLSKSSLRILI